MLLNRIDDRVLRLLLDSEYHKHYSKEDVIRTIVAPIKNKKALAVFKDDRIVSLLTWAFLNKEQVDGYLSKTRKLRAKDFEQTEGDLWFIDFIAPYGDVKTIIKEYQREFSVLYPDVEAGKMFRRAKGYSAPVVVRPR
jgi:hemolysin-activating ACP:hemolysin acyltransferase